MPPNSSSPSTRATPDIAYVASYPPRECGIATFTRDVVTAVERANHSSRPMLVAVNDGLLRHRYPDVVSAQIERDVPSSYDSAAGYVSNSGCRVVNIQHEYGLFGGVWGSHLLRFMDQVRQPICMTLHTVLPRPDPSLRQVTRDLIERSAVTTLLSQSAIDILVQDYGVTPSRLRFIPHGAPHVRRIAEAKPKQALGLQDRLVLTTCGLMNPGKGIQYAIDALPALVAEFPEIVYVVAGETHPGVLATSGEAYRGELEAQVERLGLGHNVRFVNRYLSYRELVLHLLATDVYVVPYLDLKQAVSGTMAYALGCGRAIVSTASTYAREVLAEGRGELVEPRDPDSLVQSIGRILRDPAYKNGLQSRAYALGRRMSWSYVGAAYGRAHADICSAEYRVPRVMIEPDWWADGGHAPDPRLSSIDLATLSAPSQTAVPV